VMEIALFDELRTLADDYRNAANARAASRG
jgi:hypothetical protein